ncbi:MAG: hypothetical protein J6S41_04105, partial [Clostridia bacterium]|nr:hypothetical protein [Clostridia bacterium]
SPGRDRKKKKRDRIYKVFKHRERNGAIIPLYAPSANKSTGKNGQTYEYHKKNLHRLTGRGYDRSTSSHRM